MTLRDRADEIISMIDVGLQNPVPEMYRDVAPPIDRNCWRCYSPATKVTSETGLCDGCVAELREEREPDPVPLADELPGVIEIDEAGVAHWNGVDIPITPEQLEALPDTVIGRYIVFDEIGAGPHLDGERFAADMNRLLDGIRRMGESIVESVKPAFDMIAEAMRTMNENMAEERVDRNRFVCPQHGPQRAGGHCPTCVRRRR